MKDTSVIEKLAEIYPQLYLDPDVVSQELYRKVVLQGAEAPTRSLAHFQGNLLDREEEIDTPAGPVRVVTLHNRKDFEIFIRAMMAARSGPLSPVPPTQGAATLVTFNWNRIYARREAFLKEQREAGNPFPDWNAEFARFTSVRDNYQDMIIVLSWGPYSNISARTVGLTPEEWLEKSGTIRKYHELTHVICRRLYPDRISAVWDEFVADAIGIYAAYGRIIGDMELLFLGFRNGTYIGGRLENYTEYAAGLADAADTILKRFAQADMEHPHIGSFALIPILMEYQDELEPLCKKGTV